MKKNLGGKRIGAGRKPLSGKYKEQTVPVRLPLSKVEWVKSILEKPSLAVDNEKTLIPFYSSKVAAGFADNHDNTDAEFIDLNDYLIQNPDKTFIIRATGDSMIDAGIFEGDLLIVDKARIPKHKDIVIASINTDVTVKRLMQNGEKTYLKAENEAYPDIILENGDDFHILGVVTYMIHKA
jgi:DNA polymerase V